MTSLLTYLVEDDGTAFADFVWCKILVDFSQPLLPCGIVFGVANTSLTLHSHKPSGKTSLIDLCIDLLFALTCQLLHITTNSNETYIGPSTRNNIDSSFFGRVKKLLNISNALKIIDTLFRRMISPIKV